MFICQMHAALWRDWGPKSRKQFGAGVGGREGPVSCTLKNHFLRIVSNFFYDASLASVYFREVAGDCLDCLAHVLSRAWWVKRPRASRAPPCVRLFSSSRLVTVVTDGEQPPLSFPLPPPTLSTNTSGILVLSSVNFFISDWSWKP